MAAYHEAGHAVMAYLSGLPIESVSVARKRDGLPTKQGKSSVNALGRTTLRSGSPTSYRAACARNGETPMSARDWLTANAEHGLGGPAAERILTGRESGDDADRDGARKALALAQRATKADGGSARFQRTPLMSTTWRRVVHAIKKHWPLVDALARELLARGSLTGGEVRAVLQRTTSRAP